MAEADPQKTFEVASTDENLTRLLARTGAGEEIILSRAGVPVAKLIPYREPALPPRRPGAWKHLQGTISAEEAMASCYTDEEWDEILSQDIDPDRR